MNFRSGLLLVVSVLVICSVRCDPELVFSINAGDLNTTDTSGLSYDADSNGVGSVAACQNLTASEFPPADEWLYRKERFGNFSYSFNLTGDGYYTVIMKFMDCWHEKADDRIFKVLFNDRKVMEIDVVERVGFRTALTENFWFSVCNGSLFRDGEEIELENGTTTVKIEFMEVKNPPILNAMAVVKQLTTDEKLPESLLPNGKSTEGAKFHECESRLLVSKTEAKGEEPKITYVFNFNNWVVNHNYYGANAKPERKLVTDK